jgi:hypothetical protein
MMKIDDLLPLDLVLRTYASLPEMNPLTEKDALHEAQVIDVRFDALAGVVGILFELRQALQFHQANTGVLIVHGVRELTWSGPARDTALTAWSIGSSVPRAKDRLFGLSLVMWPYPGAQLSLTAESAAFFVGDVPGLSEAPPDYTDRDRSALGHEVAGWNSSFDPVSAVFLDSAACGSGSPSGG